MTTKPNLRNPLSDQSLLHKLLELEEQLANNSYNLKTIQDIVGVYTVC